MASETVGGDEAKPSRAGLASRAKWYILSYPLFWLGVVFVIPMAMLFVFSFYVNVPGGAYRPGFTVENYVRFFTTELYLRQLWLTIEISLITTGASLLLGYPVAYYLARMDRPRVRSVLLITIVSTLWITYIIRAYAWQVILASRGILSSVAVGLGILQSHQSFYPGYWALIVGMVYVFLPFMILSLYSSLRNVDWELTEASKNLGAGPMTTFRRVTLPLSKNGVLSGSALVFILSLGAYVIPRLLGSASERTLPVLIELQVIQETNYPFGAVMSIALVFVVVGSLALLLRFTNMTAAGLGGDET
jgi:putative spermidine/putrescine transport system permease protein